MRRSRLAFGVAVVAAGVASVSAPATVIDAFGDAQDTFGAGPPLLDIDTISIVYDERFVHFEMTFHTPISAPSLGQPDGVGGFFDLDTDQNALTGGAPAQNMFSPPFVTLVAGIDYRINLASEFLNPGFVDVIEEGVGVVDVVPITYGPTSLSGRISLASLGGDDGLMDFTAAIGTEPQPTDAMDVVGTSKMSPTPCPWDCDGAERTDGTVGIVDFLALLAQWGGPGSCDFDGGGVGIVDFLALLAHWGPCP